MEIKTFFAQDGTGSVVPLPTAYLYLPGTDTLVSGLQNANGGALTNPFTGTNEGQLTVAAPDGEYDLRITGTGRDVRIPIRFADASLYPVAIAARDEAVSARAASEGAAAQSATILDQVAAAADGAGIQPDPATPTVPPSGVVNGATYWAAIEGGEQLYRNTAGVGAPVIIGGKATTRPSKAVVDAAKRAADDLKDQLDLGLTRTTQLTGTTPLVTGSATDGSFIYGPNAATPAKGRLKAINAYIHSGPNATLYLFGPTGVPLAIIPVSAPTGLNSWTVASGALPDIEVPAGSYAAIMGATNITGRVANVTIVAGTGRRWTLGATNADPATFILTSQAYAINIEVDTYTDTVAQRLAAVPAAISEAQNILKAEVGYEMGLVTRVVGTASLNAGNANSAGQVVYGPAAPSTEALTLKGIRIYGTAGAGTVYIIAPDGAGLKTLASFGVTLVAGLNTITASQGVPAIDVPVGSYIAYKATTTGAGRMAQDAAAPGTGKRFDGADLLEGKVTGTVSAAIEYQINMFGEVVAPTVKAQVEAAIPAVVAQNLQALTIMTRGPLPIARSKFPGTTTPDGWALNGWAVNNGLISPASGGGWSVVARSGKGSAISRRTTRAKVRIINPASVFAIGTFPTFATLTYGTMGIVDLAAGTISLARYDGTTITSAATQSIGFTPGSFVMVELKKRRMLNILTLTDLRTRQSASVSYDVSPGAGATNAGRQWGEPSVAYISGQIAVEDFSSQFDAPKALHALILGDSNTEGSVLGADYNRAWGYQIEDARFAAHGVRDVLVGGRGGETSGNLVDRWAVDGASFAPRYVAISEGTNDSQRSTWRDRIAQLRDQTLALGAEPIFCTPVPNADDATTKTADMVADIRNSYFGRYRFIDFSLAVSNNHDSATWNPAFLKDNLHANALGQDAMFAQAMADAPELVGVF